MLLKEPPCASPPAVALWRSSLRAAVTTLHVWCAAPPPQVPHPIPPPTALEETLNSTERPPQARQQDESGRLKFLGRKTETLRAFLTPRFSGEPQLWSGICGVPWWLQGFRSCWKINLISFFFLFLTSAKCDCVFYVSDKQEKKCETRSGKFWNFKLEVVLGGVRGKAGRMDVVGEPWIHCGSGAPLIPAQRCSSRLTVFISWSYPHDVNKCVFRLWMLLCSFVILVCCVQVQAHHLGFQRFFIKFCFCFKMKFIIRFFFWGEF